MSNSEPLIRLQNYPIDWNAVDDTRRWLSRELIAILDHFGWGNQVYISVVEAMPDGLMRAVSLGNIPEEIATTYGEFVGTFRWSKPNIRKEAAGIAGLCASLGEPVVFPDVSDSNSEFFPYYVEFRASVPTGGILCYPIMEPNDPETPLAVLNLTSKEPDFFRPDDVARLSLSVMSIIPVVQKVIYEGRAKDVFPTVDHRPGLRDNVRATALAMPKPEHQTHQPDSDQDGLEDLQIADELRPIVAALIAELRSNWRREHPTKQEMVMRYFFEQAGNLVATEELVPWFEQESSAPDISVQKIISNLNKRLEKHNLRIESVSTYRLTQADPSSED